jgi:hypothetical protein
MKTGSISHGTMREEDLIPRFIEAAEQVITECTREIRRLQWIDPAPSFVVAANTEFAKRFQSMTSKLEDIKRRMKRPSYYDRDNEGAAYDLNETLVDLLDELSPEGHYFGSHPGNNSDYGWWPSEET